MADTAQRFQEPTRNRRGDATGCGRRSAAERWFLYAAILCGGSYTRGQDLLGARFEPLAPENRTEVAGKNGAPQPGGLTEASHGLNPVLHSAGRTANLGPLGLSLGLLSSLEYNDNVRVEPHGTPGMIATGGMRFESSYQLTSLQELVVQGEISNRFPIIGPGKRQRLLSVSPNSALRFNIWVKRLRLSPFVRYRRTLDPVASPVVSQTTILDQAAFADGLQADLPLFKGGLQVVGWQEWMRQKGDESLALKTWSRVAAIRLIREVSSAHSLSAGLGATRATMENGPAGKSQTFTSEIADEWRVSANKLVSLGAGFATSRYNDSRTTGDFSRGNVPVWRAALNHKLRESLSYALAYNGTVAAGVTSNFVRIQEISLAPHLAFTRTISIETAAAWEWIHESGTLGETAERSRVSLTLGYMPISQLNLQLRLERIDKSSIYAEREYRQNRVTLSGTWDL